MNIRLIGHDFKYAIEQILLSIFPEERAAFVEKDLPDNFVSSSLDLRAGYGISTTKVIYNGKTATACEKTRTPLPDNKLLRKRGLQKIIKLSFYKASVQITGKCPPWGAVTGIRPVKLARKYMAENSSSPEEAAIFLSDEYYVSPDRSQLCADVAAVSLKAKDLLSSNEISLYIGIPFCPSRCSYCSFVSQSVEKSFKLIGPYMRALQRELEETGKLVKELGMTVKTVYIGGGTPTTLSAEMLTRLMSTISDSFDLDSCTEYTVEAGRPDTITQDKLNVIKSHGATRISINPQSMNDLVLKEIGRSHTSSQITESFLLARRLGFDLINMDLIAGLPTDTVEGFKSSLDQVLALSPENITIHTLSLKRGSRLIENGYDISGGQTVGAMLDYAFHALRSDGFSPYYLYRQKFTPGGFENTGWARSGAEGLYNICIMEELHSIISLGAGGVTKLVDPSSGRIQRVFNKKYPLEYTNDIEQIINSKKILLD